MSSTSSIGGLEVRDWEGSAFDPSNRRLFSILPDCDADEAYCVRHDREMEAITPVIHSDGALFGPAAGWDVYSCPACAIEVGPIAKRLFRERVAWAFSVYDDPDVEDLDDAFRYIGEADEFDHTDDVEVDR